MFVLSIQTFASKPSFYFCIIIYLFGIVVKCSGAGCGGFSACSECIQQPQCSWCSKLKGSSEKFNEAKCIEEKEVHLCENGFSESPVNSMKIISNKNVVEHREGGTIQLQPQELQLDLRVGVPYTIDIKFQKANDYPIDLYYLLDFSKSMQEQKKRLSELGVKLAVEMEKKTSRLQLGFGSFVDKVALPYASIHPNHLKSPCEGCAGPYSFKNHLPLNGNKELFSRQLRNAKMSGNEDTPEGGFDALLQSMVCTKDINWRNDSQRIIVFCTDAPFHIAGDGKLGGVVEPHDGKCYLNSNGDYTHALEFDYPSISLINAKAKEHSMNIVFAVPEKRRKDYENLKNAIEGASVGVIVNTNDIIDLVIQHYKKMSVSVMLTNQISGSVDIKYSTKCPREDWWRDARGCSGLKGGDVVHFKATIKAHDCSVPEQTVEIKPIGIIDSLKIKLKLYCTCDCQNTNHKHFQVNSTSCTNRGNLSCGRCNCLKSFNGAYCECEHRQNFKSSRGLATHPEGCKKNSDCSNRGSCSCGRCICEQPTDFEGTVDGDFCECDDYSCPKDNAGVKCSGHGVCKCGTCHCKDGWTKEDCSCSKEEESCKAPGKDEVCSGRGSCVCGRCECNAPGIEGTSSYIGPYCERCVGCKVECTESLHNCVECQVHKDGPLHVDLCANCSIQVNNTFDGVTHLQNMTETSVLCRPIAKDSNGCSFQYVAFYFNDEIMVHAEQTKRCPFQVNIAAIAAGVAGSTVLAGLVILLLWKVCTMVHDKREYEKFEKQRSDTKWGRNDNPLYRKALTTHINPLFQEDPISPTNDVIFRKTTQNETKHNSKNV